MIILVNFARSNGVIEFTKKWNRKVCGDEVDFLAVLPWVDVLVVLLADNDNDKMNKD